MLLVLLAAGTLATSGSLARAAEERVANRLSGEHSPYLRQHARQPVHWYPWGPEAFAAARRLDRPILLSIGYSTCHWCHVMARESFQDEGIAAQLNDHFVAIKVDREERPDVDEVYITAVQLSAGKAGWPLNVFLTPDGKPFFGVTYLARSELAELLRSVTEGWSREDRRRQLEQGAERLAARVGEALVRPPRAGNATPALIPAAARGYLEKLDEEHGGFGEAPKFPPALRLGVLLAAHRRAPDPKLLRAVTLTLERMARGGLWDHLGGGFHRYTVDERWEVPHFEKMLYDNAMLAWCALETHAVTGREEHRRLAAETLQFALRELRDPAGGFHAALDAESAGPDGERGEGRYYTWTRTEVAGVLGKSDGDLFSRIYGIEERGPVAGRAVPNLLRRTVAEWARELRLSPSTLESRLEPLRARLRAARALRPRPAVDDKVIASWNGLMLRALAAAYGATGEQQYLRAARECATHLLERQRVSEGAGGPARLVHTWRAGTPGTTRYLEDDASVAVGLLELHRVDEAGGKWLRAARELAETMVTDFWDAQQGGFLRERDAVLHAVGRTANPVDDALPSGHALAALALVRLARLTGEPGYRERARTMLDGYALEMRRHPELLPGLLLAADTYFRQQEDEAPTGATAPRESPVRATLEGVPEVLPAGREAVVTVRLAMLAGWHVNAATVLPDRAMVATRITLEPGQFRLVGVDYPPGAPLAVPYSRQPLPVWRGSVALRVRVRAGPGGARGEALRLRLRYQACNEQLCAAPITVVLGAPPATAGAK